MTKRSMKDFGEQNKLLGVQIKYDINRIFIRISVYISAIYHKYATTLTTAGNYRTPMTINTRLSKPNAHISRAGKEYMSRVSYREVVGALLWC